MRQEDRHETWQVKRAAVCAAAACQGVRRPGHATGIPCTARPFDTPARETYNRAMVRNLEPVERREPLTSGEEV